MPETAMAFTKTTPCELITEDVIVKGEKNVDILGRFEKIDMTLFLLFQLLM